MRQSWLFLICSLVVLASQTACRQTASNSQFAPVGPLTPVGANTAAAALSPLGQPTRVAPPPTGSFGSPNNYLGNTAPTGGQAYHPQGSPAYDSFSSVPAAPNAAAGQMPFDSGVAPTGWSAPVDGSHPAAVATPHSTVAPNSNRTGGMRVIDMTQAPPPPGYHPPAPQFHQQPAPGYPAPGYPASTPGGFAPMPADAPRAYEQPMVQFPGAGEIASQQTFSAPPRIQPNLGPSHGNGFHEFPMQPSVMEPNFRAASQFPSSQPSTDPVGSDFENQGGNLPWRRPDSRY